MHTQEEALTTILCELYITPTGLHAEELEKKVSTKIAAGFQYSDLLSILHQKESVSNVITEGGYKMYLLPKGISLVKSKRCCSRGV